MTAGGTDLSGDALAAVSCRRCYRRFPAAIHTCPSCQLPLSPLMDAKAVEEKLAGVRRKTVLTLGILALSLAVAGWLGFELRISRRELAAREEAGNGQVKRAEDLAGVRLKIVPEAGLRLLDRRGVEVVEHELQEDEVHAFRAWEAGGEGGAGRPASVVWYGANSCSCLVDAADLSPDYKRVYDGASLESEILFVLLRQLRRQAPWTGGCVSETVDGAAIGYLIHPSGMITVVVSRSAKNPARCRVGFSRSIFSTTINIMGRGFSRGLDSDSPAAPRPLP
ncbi:MAG TPA: hypothetical protein PK280_14395 [Planctomycetota bacterium]|nr:hypothetical protein [Planctomycetota bacterium]